MIRVAEITGGVVRAMDSSGDLMRAEGLSFRYPAKSGGLESLFGRVEFADTFGLDALHERYVHSLSRGQLARLSYVIWLSKPALLYIGDEVGIGVDDDGADALAEALRAKIEGGSSVVLTSPRRSGAVVGRLLGPSGRDARD